MVVVAGCGGAMDSYRVQVVLVEESECGEYEAIQCVPGFTLSHNQGTGKQTDTGKVSQCSSVSS